MQAFTLLIIGFSVFAAAILWFAYLFFLRDMEKTPLGLIACSVLLAALAGLQFEHFRFLTSGADLFAEQLYVFLLLLTPPAFYFFSKEILVPRSTKSWLELVNLVPLGLSFVLPVNTIAPIAFAIGAAYTIWFASYVYGMRRNVSRYHFELFFFGFFAVLAVLVLILGALTPGMDPAIFYLAYANFTGVALLLVVATLIIFPDLLGDFSDAARLTYAKSTLGGVDTDATLVRLSQLMDDEKIFQNEGLSLAMLADELDLGGHQLSELINSSFGMGYSRYIRERRVAEASRLLTEEPDVSVLAISLQTGFKSQSNFYAAFREITGKAPGSYRKARAKSPHDS